MGKKIPKVKYSQIRSRLRTFDVLNCVPYGAFWGWIGHTADVYVCQETGQVMVNEATQKKYAGKSGVQLTPMAEWIHNYTRYGRVFWRQCDIRHTIYSNRENAELLCAEHIKKYRGTPYPDLKTAAGKWFLANARLDLPIWKNNPWTNADIDTIFFCSHLIGHKFRYCGLAEDLNPAELDTKDFRPGRAFENFLGDGVSLAGEVQIVRR